MLKFQRALLGELAFVFLGVLGVVTTVVFAATTLRLFYRGEGVGLGLMLELIPSLLPVALVQSIPFSWLAAVALVLGRWVADREVTALRSAGLHLRTIVVPILAFGLLLSIGTTFTNAYAAPQAQRSLREGVRRYLGVFLASLKNVDRRVTMENGRFSFSRYEGGAFYDVELDRRRSDGELDMKVIARRAKIRKPVASDAQEKLDFAFEDAYVLQTSESGEPTVAHQGGTSSLRMGRVERIGASVLFNEFFGTQRFVERPKDMVLPDLLYASERGGVWHGSRARVLVVLHGRFAAGLLPFFLALFGTGMALALPSGGRRVRHFLVCFMPPILVYFPLHLAGPQLGRTGALPPWLVAWLPIAAVGVLGSILLARAFRR